MVVPQSAEAEKAIIGALYAFPKKAIPQCLNAGIKEEFFFTPSNQFLFKYAVWREGKSFPFDLPLVVDHLTKQGRIQEVGGASAMVQIFSASPSMANFDHYLAVLKESAARRHAFDKLNELQSGEDPPNADDLAHSLMQLAEEALAINNSETERTLQDCLTDFEEGLAEKFKDDTKAYGILTGCEKLDNLTLGLHPRTVTFITGKPSTGKSVLALQLACEALKQGKAAIYFSMEMSEQEVIVRIVCYLSGVPMEKIQKPKQLVKDDIKKVKEALELIKTFRFTIDTRPSLNMSQIRATVIGHRQDFDIMFVDYLQLSGVEFQHFKLQRSGQLEHFSRKLKEIAKEQELAVVCLSQLNDKGQTKSSTAPQEDGDNLWRILAKSASEDEDPEVYGIKLDKNRNGKRFETVYGHLDGQYQSFFWSNAE